MGDSEDKFPRYWVITQEGQELAKTNSGKSLSPMETEILDDLSAGDITDRYFLSGTFGLERWEVKGALRNLKRRNLIAYISEN